MDDDDILYRLDTQSRHFFEHLMNAARGDSAPAKRRPVVIDLTKVLKGKRARKQVTDGDQLFFKQNNDRNYRSRVADPTEVETIMAGAEAEPPAGLQWVAVVKQVCPGVHVQRFVYLPETSAPDLSELACEFLFLRAGSEGPRNTQAHLEGKSSQ
jgi:hypothetical protein